MRLLPKNIHDCIVAMGKLPGVGPKTAQRLALHLMKHPYLAASLGQTMLNLSKGILTCTICGAYATKNPCDLCTDPSRDHTQLCIVETILDAMVMERAGTYRGTYYILGGTLSPLDGIGPESLHLNGFLDRVRPPGTHIQEVILALNPTIEGETTALYIVRLLKPFGIKTTRLARGVPMGSHLSYMDDQTLISAMKERQVCE